MPLRHDFVQSDTSATSLAFGGGASDGHETSMVKHRQAAQALCKKTAWQIVMWHRAADIVMTHKVPPNDDVLH